VFSEVACRGDRVELFGKARFTSIRDASLTSVADGVDDPFAEVEFEVAVVVVALSFELDDVVTDELTVEVCAPSVEVEPGNEFGVLGAVVGLETEFGELGVVVDVVDELTLLVLLKSGGIIVLRLRELIGMVLFS